MPIVSLVTARMEMSGGVAPSPDARRRWELVLVAVGGAQLVSTSLHFYWFTRGDVTVRGVAVDVLFGLLGVLVLLGAYWLNESVVPESLYRTVALWTASGAVVLSVVTVGGLSVGATAGVTAAELVRSLQFGVGVGALLGLGGGFDKARSVELMRRAEVARQQADWLRGQHEEIERMNRLLGHHVRNAANVVRGHATRLQKGGSVEDHVPPIRAQTENLVRLVDGVRTLTRATSIRDADAPRTVDLDSVVEHAAERAETGRAGASVETTRVPAVTVTVAPLFEDALVHLFGALLANGDRDAPRVTVAGSHAGQTATLRVADDGPAFLGDPFAMEGPLHHGLGLYVARELVEPRGDVSLDCTTPHGSILRLELPVAGGEHTT